MKGLFVEHLRSRSFVWTIGPVCCVLLVWQRIKGMWLLSVLNFLEVSSDGFPVPKLALGWPCRARRTPGRFISLIIGFCHTDVSHGRPVPKPFRFLCLNLIDLSHSFHNLLQTCRYICVLSAVLWQHIQPQLTPLCISGVQFTVTCHKLAELVITPSGSHSQWRELATLYTSFLQLVKTCLGMPGNFSK